MIVYREWYVCVLMFLVYGSVLQARSPISFGNGESSVEVGQDATFVVGHPNGMLINAGRVAAQNGGFITGHTIRFNRGFLGTNNANHMINGIFRPSAQRPVAADDVAHMGRVELGDNPDIQELDLAIATPEGFGHACLVRPGGVLLRGQPVFLGTDDLTLENGVTLLGIAVQNSLTTNIALNNGILVLQDDLRLSNDIQFTGNGQIVLNGRRLLLGGSAALYKDIILWNSPQDIQLNSLVKLNGIWGFLGNGQINGNGNVLDISGGGILAILPGSSLAISDVVLKGLGTGRLLMAPDAVIRLSKTTIEMDRSYIINTGTVVVDGDTTVITRDKFLDFTGLGKLIVDRVALTYDTLDFDDQFNIRPLRINDPAQQFIQIINNGSIRRYRVNPISFLSYSSDTLLDRYAHVAPLNTITIFPVPDPVTKELNHTVGIDGGTNFLAFARSNDPLLSVSQGVQARYKNMVFRSFSPKHLALEQDSELIFDDEVSIELARDEQLDVEWPIEGNVYLRGNGNTFTFGPNGRMTLRGPRARLVLQNVRVRGITQGSFVCTDNQGILAFQNVEWIQQGPFTFDCGGIQVIADWQVTGPHTFTYATTMPLTMMPNAALTFFRGATFNYQPIDGNRELLQTDQTNDLVFDQATLQSPAPGMLLRNLRLVLRNRNFIDNPGGTGASDGIQLDQSVQTIAGQEDVFEVLEGFFGG